jgi:hydrogenase maturation protease
VVLGVGNILLSDEGVGVRAVERFLELYEVPEGVAVIDGGTSGMDLLDALSGVDLLVVADAVQAGRPPGTVLTIAGADVPVFFRNKLSPHQVSLSDVLANLEFIDAAPKETVIVGVQPTSLATHLGLTEAVKGRLPQVVQRMAEALQARGVVLKHRVLSG